MLMIDQLHCLEGTLFSFGLMSSKCAGWLNGSSFLVASLALNPRVPRDGVIKLQASSGVCHVVSQRERVCVRVCVSVGRRLCTLAIKHWHSEKIKELFTLLDLCVSSLRRGQANLLCIVLLKNRKDFV